VTLEPTGLRGVVLVRSAPAADERGSFVRIWCARTFAAAGITAAMVQTSLATNPTAGTLRGLHFQRAPSREGKLVRCVRGAIVDVAVDLRPDSPTFRRHVQAELSAVNASALYIPPGCAHGYLTLAPDSDVLYHMNDDYQPELAAGCRWNDPAFGIDWPAVPQLIGARDASYPDFDPALCAGFAGY
jgi:dTDP-4-dehydrorhamnose 3,5-epimerase